MTILHHPSALDRVRQNRTTYLPELPLLTTMTKWCKTRCQYEKAATDAVKANAAANAVEGGTAATANAVDGATTTNAIAVSIEKKESEKKKRKQQKGKEDKDASV